MTNLNLEELLLEARLEVLAHVNSTVPLRHHDELMVSMMGMGNDTVLCMVSKKDSDEHLWLVYMSHYDNHVVHYKKEYDYEEEMGG